MSESDTRVRRTLQHVAAQFPADPSSALVEVRRRGRIASIRRRRVVELMAAAAVLLLILVASLVGAHHSERIEPAGPPQQPRRDSVRVVRTLQPTSLGLQHVLRVAVSPRGYLVVTDQSQRVAEVTPSGRVLRIWGSPGTGTGQFRLQDGPVAVDARGRIYVSDAGNSRIQVFSAGGHFIRSLGTYGTGAGHLITPRDLTVDASGNVYVADDSAGNLTKLSPTGEQLWRLDHTDSSDKDLYGHFHFVGFDPAGELVAANDDAGRVIWLSRDGTKRAAFGSGRSSFRSGGASRAVGEFPHGACGASTDPFGRLYIGSCEDPSVSKHEIEIFNSRHHELAKLADAPFSTAPVFLANSTAVFVTPHGSIDLARIVLPKG